MKVTFILKNLTDVFYNGGFGIVGLLQEATNLDRFRRLTTGTAKDLQITMKVGQSNQFRDKVELNQILRTNPEPAFTLEPRMGYKLATFNF